MEKSQNSSIGHFDGLANLVATRFADKEGWFKFTMFFHGQFKNFMFFLLRWIDEFWDVFPAIVQWISHFPFLWAINKFLDFFLLRPVDKFHTPPPPLQMSLFFSSDKINKFFSYDWLIFRKEINKKDISKRPVKDHQVLCSAKLA